MYNDASSAFGKNLLNPELLSLLQQAVIEVQIEIPEAEQHRLAGLKSFLPALTMNYMCLIEVDEPLRKVSISGPQQSNARALALAKTSWQPAAFLTRESPTFRTCQPPTWQPAAFPHVRRYGSALWSLRER